VSDERESAGKPDIGFVARMVVHRNVVSGREAKENL
jgi:hypothetical protein